MANDQPLPTSSIYQALIEGLRLDDGSGLLRAEASSYPVEVSHIKKQADKLSIDAVYCVGNMPLVYFRQLDSDSPQRIREQIQRLHQQVWNQGRVPFLFVVTPGQIRVFNGYALPASDAQTLEHPGRLLFPKPETEPGARLNTVLQNLISVEMVRQAVDRELGLFKRESLVSGDIWRDEYIAQFVTAKTRVDQRLLNNLRQVRSRLVKLDLNVSIIHRLLIRSLFIMYLQDRDAVPNDCLLTNRKYFEVLDDPATTYRLFTELNLRFNGNMFPAVAGERRAVKPVHLLEIKNFLSGYNLASGQAPLFPIYDFGQIPIEMISSLYEEFLKAPDGVTGEATDKKTRGAFYTPPALVGLLLDEVSDRLKNDHPIRVLDPACGSGVFLVETYHRLIARWERSHPGETSKKPALERIMTSCLFGVDLDPDAIQVAAFSLYLAMLDHLEPEFIRRRMRRFPVLLDRNLFQADFFDPEPAFNHLKYDLIVGNPPWQSQLTPAAESYCQSHQYPVSDKQVAQAFLWRAPELCRPAGEICLLVSSKSVLYNHYGRAFRQRFFADYDVRMVLNLSALRHEQGVMFAKAIGPAAAIFFRPQKPDPKRSLAYLVPKPSPRARSFGAPVLDATEFKWLSHQQILNQDDIWKVAFWGTPRDSQLIEHLQRQQRLGDFMRNHQRVKPQEGYKSVSGDHYHPKMKGRPSIDANTNIRYVIRPDQIRPLARDRFYSLKNPGIYEPPLVIVRQSPIEGRVHAAYSDTSIVYPERFAGLPVHAKDIPYLKLLALYFPSALATYYYFMTSAEWGVERDNLALAEHLALPFVEPALETLQQDGSLFSQIVNLYDQLANLRLRSTQALNVDSAQEQTLIAKADELMFALFDLTPAEQDLARDTVKYTIPFFRNPRSSEATQQPDSDMLKTYTQVFRASLNAVATSVGSALETWIYPPLPGLSVVCFRRSFAPVSFEDVREEKSTQETDRLLSKLDEILTDPRGKDRQSLYVRRHVRIYDGNSIYLVKPSEKRFWTSSMAHQDADEVVGELLTEYKHRSAGHLA